MAEKSGAPLVETYIVTYRGHDENGNPRCRADRVVSLKKTKTSNFPMEFLENKNGLWLDADHPIGAVIMSERNVTIM